MVRCAPKPRRELAACCNDDVINGGEGRVEVRLVSMLMIL